MTAIVELETEHGARICFNPWQVVSVREIVDHPLSIVADAAGMTWRVKGSVRDVVSHLFAEVIDGTDVRMARTVRLGEPMLKQRVPSGGVS